MLRLHELTKDYYLGKNIETVHALKGISISFRKNEFVSILGPSGCGKTTLLNIIGGLDKYTTGDLFINGKSTKDFTDRDWDIYRNHRIGFIFQSYNLIPHQTILGNVELALNIAGISKDKRVEMAKKAIDRVGLVGLYNKKPSQLSGGQCQRVAIARALVNDPEILLADEPTGALDTKTSIQIMELIQEIAKDRLVIMVTHNPDLANKYSTRIVNLLDGKIVDDSNPYLDNDEIIETNNTKNEITEKEKAKMSAKDAFRLSFKNLISKKGRTTMTAFAGSIGIIGVSMVLALSGGITGYVEDMQNDMLSGNPITISTNSYDMSSLLSSTTTEEKVQILKEEGYINVNSIIERLMKSQDAFFSFQIKNEIDELYISYLNEMDPNDVAAITYDYGFEMPGSIFTDLQVRRTDSKEYMSINTIIDTYQSVLKTTSYGVYSSYVTSLTDVFGLLPDNEDYLLSQYDLKYGKVAKEKNEIMIVVNSNYELSDLTLAELGYFSEDEFLNISYRAANDEKYDESKDVTKLSYDTLLSKKFVFYNNDVIYTKDNDTGYYSYNGYRDNLNDGMELKIVGILSPKENISYGCLETGIYYTSALNEYALEVNKNSNIINDYNDAISKAKDLEGTDDEIESGLLTKVGYSQIVKYNDEYSYMNIGYKLHYYYVDSKTNEFVRDEKTQYINSSSSSTYSLTSYNLVGGEYFGANYIPSDISIYPLDFEAKNRILEYLDKWNNEGDVEVNGTTYTYEQRNEIKYVDNLSLVISMLKKLISIVTAALVAFTALSLVVSTVMIGIITYVSVVERTKEIGVIRSLGGRKKDVSNLFVAETFILGLFSGVVGVGVTYLLSVILNVIINAKFDIYPIANLPIYQAIIMILVSIFLTLISGVMPAKAAAKRDPVIALRTE